MSDDVKDFAHYADAAESVIATIEDHMPTQEVAVIAAIAQVFATLATGAPKAPTKQTVSCNEAHPQYDTYHPEGH